MFYPEMDVAPTEHPIQQEKRNIAVLLKYTHRTTSTPRSCKHPLVLSRHLVFTGTHPHNYPYKPPSVYFPSEYLLRFFSCPNQRKLSLCTEPPTTTSTFTFLPFCCLPVPLVSRPSNNQNSHWAELS